MILPVKDDKYLNAYIDIYNSAIGLFGENERGNATEETFAAQLENDVNFIEISESGNAVAFMSYHSYGKYYELTSLYVKKEYQKNGIGHKLLCHMEEQVKKDEIIFVKVLKNAPWSIQFYSKNGYMPVDNSMRETAASINILEKAWSTVLYKKV